MQVNNFEPSCFNEIIDCFLASFEGYFVTMPTDKNSYKERWKAAKLDYHLSYGMYDGELLVGFILHAVDTRNNEKIAYNTGTGVLPAYRGKRIVKDIYTVALAELKRNGITKSTLEVIKENDKAIKSYESVGFTICKDYKCFSGKLPTHSNKGITTKEIPMHKVDWAQLPNQSFYSWDNQKESILEGKYSFFQVEMNTTPLAYFIKHTSSNYIAQCDVLSPNVDWNLLFEGMQQVSETMRINNVDERHSEKINAFNKIGLQNSIDQFEMELLLS